MNFSVISTFILSGLLLFTIACARQKPDLTYDVSVSKPFFQKGQPVLLYDDGRRNSHLSSGTYAPFYTFRGQSLSASESAEVLLKLSEQAVQTLPDSIWHKGCKTYTRFTDPVSASGYC